MGKKIFLLAVILLCVLAAFVFSYVFNITITAPTNGQTLIIGTSFTIQWTHSPDYHVVPQNCAVFCGSDIISPDIPVIQDQFVWTVGQKKDGTFLAPGTYEITIESPDYDALNGPHITLAYLKINPKVIRGKIPCEKIPDCPMCFRFDPRMIMVEMKGLEFVDLALFRGGKMVAKLGKYTPGQTPLTPVKLQFTKDEFNSLQKGQTGFEIQALSSKGVILAKEAVQLEFK